MIAFKLKLSQLFRAGPASLLLLGFVVSHVSANQVAIESKAPNISTLSNWPVVLIVLIGMIAFIFALAWFVKRFGGLNFSGNRDIKILSAIPVGARERIALIDVKGQQFLIGVTNQQISHLHSFDEAVVPTVSAEPSIRQSDFFNKLQFALNPQKKTGSAPASASYQATEPPQQANAAQAGEQNQAHDNDQTKKRDENAL